MEKVQPDLSSLRVPQSSLLGPLFIVIFISDLTEVVMPVETKLHCMEMTVKHLISCPSNYSLFQSDLDNLYL